MINVLMLSPNEYVNWLTYEFEYLIDAFRGDERFSVQAYGRFRPGYNSKDRATEVLEKLYSGTYPDLLIIDISLLGELHTEDKVLFDIVKLVSSKSFIIFKTADPWRQIDWIDDLVREYRPNAFIVHSGLYTDLFNQKLNSSEVKAYMFPYCFGRRYFDMGIERKFDLGLIGRCELDNELLSKRSFRKKINEKIEIYYEPSLSKIRKKIGFKNYLNRYSSLILNLNHCKASWNTPVRPKQNRDYFHTPFRFVEAPACGTLTVAPFHFKELNEFYFPQGTYFCLENDIDNLDDVLRNIKNNSDSFLEKKENAYRMVMKNHQASNRVNFIHDIFQMKNDIEARDYYLEKF